MENETAWCPTAPSNIGGPRRGSLDFFSADFDAKLALQKGLSLTPPDPAAPALDYMSKCRLLLPTEMPESLAGRERASKQKTGAETTRQKHEGFKEKTLANIQRIRERTNTSLQSVMDLADRAGPLSTLRSWHQAHCRVRVDTRHASGRRGTAEGTLVAYDRYMNLILCDVVENYTVLLKVPRVKAKVPALVARASQGDDEANKQVRWVNKQDHRQRSLGQIFIKGDNVISISCMPPIQRPDVAGCCGD